MKTHKDLFDKICSFKNLHSAYLKARRCRRYRIESSNKEVGKGIPIGNLTSQLFANIYLNELDQFIKHNLRARYYIRYMDDFFIIGFDKKELRRVKKRVGNFLLNELTLKLHPKKAEVFPADKGIDFLGYRAFGNYRLLRKSTVKRFVKRTRAYLRRLDEGLMAQKNFNQSLQSWSAYAGHADSWLLRRDLENKLKVGLRSASETKAGLPADSAFVAEATSAKEAASGKAGTVLAPPQNATTTTSTQ